MAALLACLSMIVRSPATEPWADKIPSNITNYSRSVRSCRGETSRCNAGHERKEPRRRRGGRGKRNNVDDTLEGAHRKPPSPKLADLIMPVLKAREKAQSEALEKQRGSSVPPDGNPASEAGESATEAADGAAEASEATPGETRR